MGIRELMQHWQVHAGAPLTARCYDVRLPLHDAARIRALVDLFPARTETQLITELLGAALDELQAALPYVEGDAVIAEDELGDPIYEDAGLTPRFHRLTRHYLQALQAELRAGGEQTS